MVGLPSTDYPADPLAVPGERVSWLVCPWGPWFLTTPLIEVKLWDRRANSVLNFSTYFTRNIHDSIQLPLLGNRMNKWRVSRSVKSISRKNTQLHSNLHLQVYPFLQSFWNKFEWLLVRKIRFVEKTYSFINFLKGLCFIQPYCEINNNVTLKSFLTAR